MKGNGNMDGPGMHRKFAASVHIFEELHGGKGRRNVRNNI